MPKSKKRSASGGKKSRVTNRSSTPKQGFDPGQGSLPQGLNSGFKGAGGKPKLFPGRTGGR